MSFAEMTVDEVRGEFRSRALPEGVRCRLIGRRGTVRFYSEIGTVELYRKRRVWWVGVALRATKRTDERRIGSFEDLLAAVREIEVTS